MEDDDSSEDATLNLLIRSQTAVAEHRTGRAFVARTLRLNLDYFPHCIELPMPPLIAVDSVAYTDANGAAQTVDSALYEVDIYSTPGKLRPVWGESWPSIGRGFNPVRITYQAGYLAPGSPQDLTDNSYLPPALRTWLSARIATLYEQREQLIIGTIVSDLPRGHGDALLDELILGERLF